MWPSTVPNGNAFSEQLDMTQLASRISVRTQAFLRGLRVNERLVYDMRDES